MENENAEALEQLAEICRRFGSPLAQSQTMARQLWKRSGQLAGERGIKQTEALDHLLTLMIKGRDGSGPDNPA